MKFWYDNWSSLDSLDDRVENFVCPKVKVADLWTGNGWSVQLIDE